MITVAQDSIVSIPDFAFLDALIEEGVDTNGDGLISYREAEATISLNVDNGRICRDSSCWDRTPIESLEGIEAFINLDSLSCSGHPMCELDLSQNRTLKYLDVSGPGWWEFYSIFQTTGYLNALNLSECTALEYLNCNNNKLPGLHLEQLTALKYLDCSSNQLGTLDISNNAKLENLSCSYNQLSSLDLSGNSALQVVNCQENNLLSLDLSGNPGLQVVNCQENNLLSLDLSGNPALQVVNCEDNNLLFLDLTNNPALEVIRCGGNYLYCLDLSNNMELEKIDLRRSQIREVCVWEMPFPPDGIVTYLFNSPYLYFTQSCQNCTDTLACIPDGAFLSALFESGVDKNGDSIISVRETQLVTTLDLSDREIDDVSGLEYFTELQFLDLSGNMIARLDLSNQSKLVYLNCSNNQLPWLNFPFQTELTHLNCSNNYISELDMTFLPALTCLDCNGNDLNTLNISENKLIDTLIISNMPGLTEVCVWSESLPQDGLYVDTSFSYNAYFSHFCESVGDILEDNDNFINSANIYTGHKYSDLFISVGDDDWYEFNIDRYFSETQPVYFQFETVQLNGHVVIELWKIKNDFSWELGDLVFSSPIGHAREIMNFVLSPGDYRLHIFSDSGSATEYSINIDDSSYPEIYLSPLSISFADADIYRTHTKQLMISNQGRQELHIDSIHNSLIGSKITPGKGLLEPGEKLDFTVELFPRTLKEFEGELDFFTSKISYEDMKVPIYGNGHLSQYVVILKEVIDTLSAGFWKANGLKLSNFKTDYALFLKQAAVVTYHTSENTNDKTLQSDQIAGTWAYTTLRDSTMIPPKEVLNFWLMLDASELQEGDYYAEVILEWYNPSYLKGFIPIRLHVKDTTVNNLSSEMPELLKVYPNPTSGYVKIQIIKEDTYNITVTSMEGHQVYQSFLQGITCELDLSSLRNGVYFITISSKNRVITRKIIKL